MPVNVVDCAATVKPLVLFVGAVVDCVPAEPGTVGGAATAPPVGVVVLPESGLELAWVADAAWDEGVSVAGFSAMAAALVSESVMQVASSIRCVSCFFTVCPNKRRWKWTSGGRCLDIILPEIHPLRSPTQTMSTIRDGTTKLRGILYKPGSLSAFGPGY